MIAGMVSEDSIPLEFLRNVEDLRYATKFEEYWEPEMLDRQSYIDGDVLVPLSMKHTGGRRD
jgi:hypothetical protein